ncbi:HNH endonuclease signature motif containing protein [Mycobacterium sp. pV006]|uniref:HNH endonuclease signature motif containing protein n=1 Tax=Mycobacterium sp. pV006 TaxID=3238983 RepID=UPI00351B9925
MNGPVASALAALKAARDAVNALDLTASSHTELLEVMDALEADSRRAPVLVHRVVNRLAAEANPLQLGATSWPKLMAFRLRISASEARQRIDAAADLGSRTAMTGEALAPVLEHTAEAQRRGRIGAEHIKVIRQFFATLPDAVDAETRVEAERTLARIAERQGPDGLRKAANRLLAYLHPDGDFSDAERARKRGVHLGPQRPDGMSRISGELTPEARAVFEVLFAKFAAPGMCNPDDETPAVTGDPADGTAAKDGRSQVQRNHDALLAVGRMLLCSGKLGQLNGLPVTVIVSTTLRELESGAGQAVTGGGSLLPMRDLIRMAAHAHHYLAVFDDHTEQALYLGRTKRCASAAQRIMLHAKYRGCTRPGCDACGYRCQAHHGREDWKRGGQTNIDDLTLACRSDNLMIENTGWTTVQRDDGRTEWIPPPSLDTGQARVNDLHHPERMLLYADDPGDAAS